MSVVLNNPELTAFLKDQVDRGHFASLESALEASVAQMMLDRDREPLDDEVLESIDRAECDFAEGNFKDWTRGEGRP